MENVPMICGALFVISQAKNEHAFINFEYSNMRSLLDASKLCQGKLNIGLYVKMEIEYGISG